MSGKLRRVVHWLPFIFAGAVGLYAVVRIAALPAADLVTYIADDTFYYLVLARNFAATGHLTFDGINSASGFHPAWLMLNATMAAAGFEGLSLVRAAIALAYAWHFVSALLVVRLIDRAGAPRVAVWAGALWLANPVSLLLVAEAMEAPLFSVALAGAALMVQELVRAPVPAARRLASASAVLALLCLVRTDGLIVAATAILAIGFALRGLGASPRRILIAMAALGVGPALAIGAFALWLRLETGYLTQASGEIKMLWGAAATVGERLAFLYHVLVRLTFGGFGHAMFGLPTKISAVAAAAGLTVVAAASWRRGKRGELDAVVLTWWLLGTAAVTVGAYALVLFEFRNWYLGLPALAMFLVIAFEAARRWGERTFASVAAVALGAMCVQAARLAHADAGRYPYARAIYESVLVFDRLVPAGEPIASFDAGVRGFFATHRVVNLDGLVNDATRPYWRTGQLDRYLERERVTYIADEEGSLQTARRFTAFPAVDPVACVPVHGSTYRDRCLWRVRRP